MLSNNNVNHLVCKSGIMVNFIPTSLRRLFVKAPRYQLILFHTGNPCGNHIRLLESTHAAVLLFPKPYLLVSTKEEMESYLEDVTD